MGVAVGVGHEVLDQRADRLGVLPGQRPQPQELGAPPAAGLVQRAQARLDELNNDSE